MLKKSKNIIIGTFSFGMIITFAVLVFNYLLAIDGALDRDAYKKQIKSVVTKSLDEAFKNKGARWPSSYVDEELDLELLYTFNKKLSKYVKRLLKRYRSDYSAVIVIDNETGKVLSAVGYKRVGNQFGKSLAFSSTHPSASLFKIITSAALLENENVSKDTIFNYRGKGTTLYKYQLNKKVTRWTRSLSLKNAFAFSNNVIFGKAAITNLGGDELYKQAVGFGFNKSMMKDLTLSKSMLALPKDQYNLAEIATGFNKETMISPVHGAILASVVANDGILKRPYIVDKVIDSALGKNVWERDNSNTRAISSKTSKQLQEMMETTVRKGTARGSFRKMNRSLKRQLKIGGKTGTITGGLPFGKRDWFTVYAMPNAKDQGKGISICVMNVNVNKWYVKSTYLAKSIIEYYYKEIAPLNKKAKTHVVKLETNLIDKV